MTQRSSVLAVPAADPAQARAHFARKLGLETDPADVWRDLQAGVADFILVDARDPASFAVAHLPSALNLPHATIDETTTAALPRDKTLVVHGRGPACNGAAKAALKLATLGFRVKEMIGGVEYWMKAGYGLVDSSPA